jgi:hypothetical protein
MGLATPARGPIYFSFAHSKPRRRGEAPNPQEAHTAFCRWKEWRPQRRQMTWTILPPRRAGVPFPMVPTFLTVRCRRSSRPGRA